MTNDFDAARKLASWYANTNPKSPVVFNPHENLARCFLVLDDALADALSIIDRMTPFLSDELEYEEQIVTDLQADIAALREPKP